MADPRESFQRKMRIQLDAWSSRIEEIKKRVQNQKNSNRQKLEEQVKQLDDKEKAARQQLDEVETAADDSWQDLKISMVSAMEDLRKTVQGFFNKIRQ